ncbi:YceI family protein [Formosa maritima]|uniref:YceI family protein n=1 Tax=Formosa maritima TaxID=2592046 RepID=A0A5D0G3I1_9FLAO|nr:YceI family protein [Formosa maritima]TYA53314.1 YceI family protein [Formosa maritima]
MKTFYLFIFLISSLSFSFIQAQTIDTSKSVIEFKIKGGMVFNVKGTFNGMKGDFNFNKNDLDNSSFDICIDAASVNTDNEKRDTHLKTEDFFHVEKYPNICFKSTSVSIKDKDYVTRGELTMHGVTKTVEIPFKFSNNTFKGSFEIERLDYKIGEDTGTLTVGSTADVTIICIVN